MKTLLISYLLGLMPIDTSLRNSRYHRESFQVYSMPPPENAKY